MVASLTRWRTSGSKRDGIVSRMQRDVLTALACTGAAVPLASRVFGERLGTVQLTGGALVLAAVLAIYTRRRTTWT